MKKISTLVAVCFLLGTAAFAQSDDAARGGYGNNGYGNNGYGNNGYGNNDQYHVYNFRSEADLIRDMNLSRSQERKISRINEKFRDDLYRLQNNRFMSAQQKKWQIDRLEMARRQDIMNVMNAFQRKRYNAWCVRNNNNNNYGNNGYGHGNGRW